uniref:Retroviral polymerase SH3-like domain-containing protein n=1 Tax=Vitis vinifera TaxID=29760 RepID=A5BF59_VITVI|nr:hypothetical protein VITISV_042366 [Vitis vinifera]
MWKSMMEDFLTIKDLLDTLEGEEVRPKELVKENLFSEETRNKAYDTENAHALIIESRERNMNREQKGHDKFEGRFENRGEYISREFETYCIKNGISHEKTVSSTLQHNGVAEKMNRTIIEKISKLDDKVVPHVFVAYGDAEFGFKLWDPTKKKLVRSRDVVFQEYQTLGDFDKNNQSKGISDGFIELVSIPLSLEQPKNEKKEIDELPRDNSDNDIPAQEPIEHDEQGE